MAGPTKGKQATKGQKQIYKENQETIVFYQYMSIGVTAFYTAVLVLGGTTGFFSQSLLTNPYRYGIYIFLSGLLDFIGLKLFGSMAVAKFNGNTLVDGGTDINMEGGFGETIKDAIILNSLLQVLSLLSDYVFYGYFLAPAYGIYKLMKDYILPWFFAPPPEEPTEEQNEKKQRKMDRKMRRSGN